ncbi:hypothetical protein L208DRAFT_1377023 [Tricholoma matsutake]|nr:hypothetical protein L208DRAFT_1377023 [Tricholoma matsutake 945]
MPSLNWVSGIATTSSECEQILQELGNAPQTKTNVKEQALLCNGYRCAISGVYDLHSCCNIAEVDATSKAVPNPLLIQTEVAHIFSESAQDGDKDYAATVFAILEMFGLGNKAKALYGSQVNSLHNVITMVITLHSEFDTLNLWLEPVPGQESNWPVHSAHPITCHIQC